MRQLHLVESHVDAGRVVVATSDGLEKFELAVDPALRAALSDAPATAKPARAVTPGEPKITPREIQVRVRSGETPEALADAHGGGLDWVMRFAGPVLAERSRIADEARRAKARRSTTEGQTVVFGEAVDERFAAHGIDPAGVRWDAHRREDGQWLLSAFWVGGQAERTAQWSVQLSSRTVAPMDDTAADLLSDRPIRPVVVEEPDEAPNLTLAPPLQPEPAAPDTATGPLPRADEVFDQARLDQRGAEDFDRPGFDEPHLPLHVPDASPAPFAPAGPRRSAVGEVRRSRPEQSDEDKAARASIPSWDDILLGVRRKRD